MKSIIRCITLISCLVASSLHAQAHSPKSEPTPLDEQVAALKIDVPRVREIFKLVATSGDQPTKQIHDEFWGLILTRIHADPIALKKIFRTEADRSFLLQDAFWESLHLSAKNHRVIVTREFDMLRNNYAKASFTSDYAKVQDAMLRAAATGQPYTLRNGQSGYITAQIAETTLAGLNATKSRFYKLTDPNWTD